MSTTATFLGEQVRLLTPTPDQVRQLGRTPEFHESGICAIHDGLLTLVTAFETPDGKPLDLPDDLPAVLSLADANDAFRTLTGGQDVSSELLPVLAGIVFEFDSPRQSRRRIRQVRGVWTMIDDIAAIGGFRPRRLQRRPALTDEGRLARVGTAMWRPTTRGDMVQRFTTGQLDAIFAERDRCIDDPERREAPMATRLVGVS